MSNCIFCSIVDKQIPSKTVYEDDKFLAFLDIAPGSKGHVLIVPKIHAENLLDLPDEYASSILPLAKKIAAGMKKVLSFTDFNIIQNNGPLAGQSVNHYHMHIIPRYDGSEVSLWTPHENDPSVTDELASKISKQIG